MREACREKVLQNMFNDVMINEVYKVRNDNHCKNRNFTKRFMH